jgi:hypothetical protein
LILCRDFKKCAVDGADCHAGAAFHLGEYERTNFSPNDLARVFGQSCFHGAVSKVNSPLNIADFKANCDFALYSQSFSAISCGAGNGKRVEASEKSGN